MGVNEKTIPCRTPFECVDAGQFVDNRLDGSFRKRLTQKEFGYTLQRLPDMVDTVSSLSFLPASGRIRRPAQEIRIRTG